MIDALAISVACLLATDAGVSSEPPKARARKLVDEGNTLVTERAYHEAATRYAEAYRLYPSPKILLNLGEAHFWAGDYVQALTNYEAYDRLTPTIAPAIATQLDARMSEANGRVGRLVLLIPEGTASATVTVDGRRVGARGRPGVPLWPGEHRVVIELPAQRRAERVALQAGQSRELRIAQMPLVAEPTDESNNVGWWLWAGVGAVVVAGIIAGVAVASGGDEFVGTGALGRSGTSTWESY